MEIILTLLLLVLPVKGEKSHQFKDVATLTGILQTKGIRVMVATPDGKKVTMGTEKSKDRLTQEVMKAIEEIPELSAAFKKPVAIKEVDPEEVQIVVIWGDGHAKKDKETEAFLKKLRETGRTVLYVGKP